MFNGILFPDVAESLLGVMENMENLLDAQIFHDADTHRKSNRNNKRGMLIWEFFQNRKLLF